MNIGHYVWCLLCCITVIIVYCAIIFFATGDRPTMRNLKKFPNKSGQDINISLQISTDYRTFRTFLLEDNRGTIASVIEMAMMSDAERINEAILMQWIGGKGKQPLTWDTLMTCLRDSELKNAC